MDDDTLTFAADDYWRHVKECGDPVEGMRQVAHVYGRSVARKLGQGGIECAPIALDPDETADYQNSLRSAWRQYANANRTTEKRGERP